ncbi:3-oxoacyl-ACP synthase III family protein [Streptomyces sp. H10-C2]|uniref:3-oxoacyl-ACP synthase III family protein n=1 Tax=unclassified Streptomyces TaxID=2593676 RepID=UPI0024BB50B6|nr:MULTISPECIES: 3-oxoacyl-ACP synthase III family protein [unclassified Streptomyces]MDJ0341807.1 3-oxoacyl-ACP synthase III family protein [Streptomyces sp. PH10-H1]MDJ0370439.1 3-oxoacyl-ACP synthase III family protein [Streptomyces sp. H10-C2]
MTGRLPSGPGMHLLAAATALPGPAIGNEVLAGRLGLSAEWVEMFIGTRTRHFAVDLGGGVGCLLADLCEQAAVRCLERAGLTVRDLAFVVLATATPDALMPTTAAVVADRLGGVGIPVYQLQSGCSGAVQAFTLAEALLAREPARPGRESGEGKGPGPYGLVLGGDVCAKHLDLQQDFRRMPPAQLVNYVIFGDGAGAAVVSAAPAPGSAAFLGLGHRLALPGQPPGQHVEWYGAADRDSALPPVSEDYKAVECLVPELAQQVCAELLDALGWSPQDLGYLLPPQLGGLMTRRITAALRSGLGVEKAVEISCVADTGNTGNALVLSQLEQLLPLLTPGARALCACVESSRWISAGFALEAS